MLKKIKVIIVISLTVFSCVLFGFHKYRILKIEGTNVEANEKEVVVNLYIEDLKKNPKPHKYDVYDPDLEHFLKLVNNNLDMKNKVMAHKIMAAIYDYKMVYENVDKVRVTFNKKTKLFKIESLKNPLNVVRFEISKSGNLERLNKENDKK